MRFRSIRDVFRCVKQNRKQFAFFGCPVCFVRICTHKNIYSFTDHLIKMHHIGLTFDLYMNVNAHRMDIAEHHS